MKWICIAYADSCASFPFVTLTRHDPNTTLTRNGAARHSGPRRFVIASLSPIFSMYILGQKIAHILRDQRPILLQREMPGVQHMYFRVWHIPQESLGARRNKDGIVLAPHDQHRRLLFAQILLPRRIQWRIGAVIVGQR